MLYAYFKKKTIEDSSMFVSIHGSRQFFSENSKSKKVQYCVKYVLRVTYP